MPVEIQWSIGKEGVGRTRLDLPPLRAFFYWLQDGELIDSADFNYDELETEIRRRRTAGEDTVPFEEALKELGL